MPCRCERIESIIHDVVEFKTLIFLSSSSCASSTVCSRSALTSAAKQRAQFLSEATAGETVQVEVNGVVYVDQQKADDLGQEVAGSEALLLVTEIDNK